MKESYSKDLANYTGPELYAGDGNIAGVAETPVAVEGRDISQKERRALCIGPDTEPETTEIRRTVWRA